MVTFMRQSTYISHWVFVILIAQIMCAACENHFMVLSKRIVHGTNALLTLSPPLDFSIALHITHSSSTDVALIWLTTCFMLMTSSLSPPPMILKNPSWHSLHLSLSWRIWVHWVTPWALPWLDMMMGFSLIRVLIASDIIARACMASCKPSAIPVDTKHKLSTTANTSYWSGNNSHKEGGLNCDPFKIKLVT